MERDGVARCRREVELAVHCFANAHPDFERVHLEMLRLIRDYGAGLEGAYRVATCRAKEKRTMKKKKRPGC